MLLLGLLLTQIGFSQQKNFVSVDSIISLLDQKSIAIKMADKTADVYRTLRSRPADIAKTNLGIEYGNINSAFNDTRLFFNQGLQLPAVYKNQQKLYDQFVAVSSYQSALTKADMNWKTRLICYAILDLDRRESILNEVERNFTEWTRIASVQKQQGEINASVLGAIKVQSTQQSLQKQLLIAERDGLVNELNLLLRNTEQVILPKLESPSLIELNTSVDQLQSHALIGLSDALIEQKKSIVKTEKSRLLPDFNFGYSNLSIIGWQTPDGQTQKYYGSNNRFGIYQLGMGLPIFNGSIKARIKSSQLGVDIAELDKLQKIDQLNSQF